MLPLPPTPRVNIEEISGKKVIYNEYLTCDMYILLDSFIFA